MNIQISKTLWLAIPALVVIYIIGSSIAIFTYRQQLANERARVYSIADNFELYKELISDSSCKPDINLFPESPRNVELAPITRKEATGSLKNGQKLYTMTYDQLDEARKKELDRYFSELVLKNYFYIITDKDDKILEIFWDKP